MAFHHSLCLSVVKRRSSGRGRQRGWCSCCRCCWFIPLLIFAVSWSWQWQQNTTPYKKTWIETKKHQDFKEKNEGIMKEIFVRTNKWLYTGFLVPPNPANKWTLVHCCPVLRFPDCAEERAAATNCAFLVFDYRGSTVTPARWDVAGHLCAAG